VRLRDDEYQALARLRHLLRVFLRFSEDAARDEGLTPQQHQLLLAVKGFGSEPPTVGMLAERLMLRHHSTVELIDRLQARALVVRRRSAADKRVASVAITARGARLLRKLSLAHRDELLRTGPELVEALVSLLGRAAPPLGKRQRPRRASRPLTRAKRAS